jgi:hypothetical protein
LPIFYPPKNVTTLYPPPGTLQIHFHQAVENEVKRLHVADVAEIQEAVMDELKKVQKEEFLAAFQKLYDHAKACIYASGAYF